MQIDIDYRDSQATVLTFVFDAGLLVMLSPAIHFGGDWDRLEEAVDEVGNCLARGLSAQYFDFYQQLDVGTDDAICGDTTHTIHFRAGASECDIGLLLAVLEESGYRSALKRLFYCDRFQQLVEIPCNDAV